jgi:hypothetical protein
MCDSPGLVFPSFFSSKAEMLCNGILPIDEIRGRDFIPAIDFMCNHVTRATLEKTYNLSMPLLPSVKMAKPDVLLESYCRVRGLLGKAGRFDESKAARIMLKDFVSGRLLYAHPPPAPAAAVSTSAPSAADSATAAAAAASAADPPLPKVESLSLGETSAAAAAGGAELDSEAEDEFQFGDDEFAPVPVVDTCKFLHRFDCSWLVTYIYTHIDDIQTYIHSYIHTYIHTYMHTYIHIYINR